MRKKPKKINLPNVNYKSEYGAWSNMRNRCLNKKTKEYKGYGGRGITICDRWLESFENFYSDMGAKPSIAHTLDRIDNNGNYCKENCRWTTQAVQLKNRRSLEEVRNDNINYKYAGKNTKGINLEVDKKIYAEFKKKTKTNGVFSKKELEKLLNKTMIEYIK